MYQPIHPMSSNTTAFIDQYRIPSSCSLVPIKKGLDCYDGDWFGFHLVHPSHAFVVHLKRTFCVNTYITLQHLHRIYHNYKQTIDPTSYISIATCKELLDSVFNDLSYKPDERTEPTWIELWSCLLELLCDIDIATSSTHFPREPPAGQIGADRLLQFQKEKENQ